MGSVKMMPIIKPVKSKFFIKWLNPSFYESAADIECNSGEKLWSLFNIKLCMRLGCAGYVICDLKKPVGYVVCKFHEKQKRIKLLNLVVIPEYRRQKLASLLLGKVKYQMKKKKANHVIACVRETNRAAHRFLLSNDFKGIGLRKDQFVDKYPDFTEREDGYLFQSI